MIPVERSRLRDPEDVVSVLAVITLVVGLLWLVLVRDRHDVPGTRDPFSVPPPSAGASGAQQGR